MLKVAITGAAGTIGTVLRKGLMPWHLLTLIDLRAIEGEETEIIDVAQDYSRLVQVLGGHDAVIHLAMDGRGGFKSDDNWVPENDKMIWNVYKACIETGVKKVIMASSIHTVAPTAKREYPTQDDLISPYSLPNPDTPYGAMKVFMEALGKYFAYKRGLEVICIRFGGVNLADRPSMPDEPYYHTVWLSHGDCIGLVRACLKAQGVTFVVVYGVSRSQIFDMSNPFGWTPKEGGRDE